MAMITNGPGTVNGPGLGVQRGITKPTENEMWTCPHCKRALYATDPSTGWCAWHQSKVCDNCAPCGSGGL